MKRKHNEGSSLIEILVGIVVLALIVVPTCTSLVMSARINAKAEQLLQDQLAVSSAVETLMATGISAGKVGTENDSDPNTNYPPPENCSVAVSVAKLNETDSYYSVTVSKGEVTVTTKIGGGT